MIEKPGVSSEDLVRHVRNAYDLHVVEVRPTAPGADAEAATYRLASHDGTYFLKLRHGAADDTAAPLQSFLAEAVDAVDAVSAVATEATTGLEAARVVAPLPDRHGRLSTVLDGYVAVLYPFVAGRSGFEVPLTREQWTALGEFVRALHGIDLPPSLRSAVRVETYGPKWRDKVRGHLATDTPPERLPDAPARELAAILRARREQLTTIVERAEQLAAVLRGKEGEPVLCHGDLHAGNVMVTDDGAVVVVDWDDPVMAPRERDLMFVGGGVGGVWNDAAECAAFHRGYGTGEIDAQTLAYYRCERIVQDVAEYCDQLLVGRPHDSEDDRELSLRHFAGQFRPDDVVDIAERTYAALRG
ncbi:phosphotransferase [Streptomyces sp. NPDC050439]|uniref:phosphotransferase n=1 Tax=unclassified Streptomyces TaxID=2593676 RepID=UPI00343C7ECE